MVKITFYQNKLQQFTGFEVLDHAEFADPGQDIVCAGVSALVINCLNSIEELTDIPFCTDSDENRGFISFQAEDASDHDAQLLIKSLILGLQSMETNYEKYIDVIFKEVQ